MDINRPQNTNTTKNPAQPTEIEREKIGVAKCCKQTIDLHAVNNPMMVCDGCKQIIKCFDTEVAFNNYRRFCASRHRRITIDNYVSWLVIVFRSYDTFSS